MAPQNTALQKTVAAPQRNINGRSRRAENTATIPKITYGSVAPATENTTMLSDWRAVGRYQEGSIFKISHSSMAKIGNSNGTKRDKKFDQLKNIKRFANSARSNLFLPSRRLAFAIKVVQRNESMLMGCLLAEQMVDSSQNNYE